MAETREVKVPDLGGADEVDLVEILVSEGDRVEAEDSLVTLESDKASMEVPSPEAGTVKSLKVAEGDSVKEGQVILLLEVEGASDSSGDSKGESKEGDSDEDERSSADSAEKESSTPKQETKDTADSKKRAESRAESGSVDLSGTDVQCEVLVLGSGPGGYTAAFRAADLGRKVVMVEKYDTLGGVCLNVGCIPSKALLHVAALLDDAKNFADHGIRFGEPSIDLDRLREWKGSVVDRLTGGLATMAQQRGVETITGTGTLVGPHRLEVETADGTGSNGKITVGFEKAILAAGSRPVKLPNFPYDDERLVDSTGALELRDIPESLLVIGGGIIGLEMATVYHALGSKITVVELFDQVMPGTDKDLVRPLLKRLEKRYEAIWTKTKVTKLESEKGGLRAHFESENSKLDVPESALFDRVLLSVGRTPNGKSIGAEAAGVEVDERGFVAVDRQMRTNVAHIFAIGDLVGQPMLAHKAMHEGKVAAEAAAGEKSFFDARVIPSVAYTDPEVAWVGLTETEAKEKGVSYEKGTFPWAASGRSLAQGRDEGSTKLLFDPESKRVLGGGIVGSHAGDLVAEIALAIEMNADAHDIGLTIHPHPTLSESVGLSAEAFEGTITDLYLPKQKKARK